MQRDPLSDEDVNPLMNRVEEKFFVSREHLEVLVDSLKEQLKEGDIDTSVRYNVNRTIYLDNKDMDAFRDNVDGIVPRFKVRIRQYAPNGTNWEDVAYVELKIKGKDAFTKKIRVRIPASQIEDIANGKPIVADRGLENINGDINRATLWKRVLAMNSIISKYGFKKQIVVGYERRAFSNPEMRITVDDNIQYYDAQPILDDAMNMITSSKGWEYVEDKTRQIKEKDYLIVEVKHDKGIPKWVKKLLKEVDAKKARISKYVAAVTSYIINKKDSGTVSRPHKVDANSVLAMIGPEKTEDRESGNVLCEGKMEEAKNPKFLDHFVEKEPKLGHSYSLKNMPEMVDEKASEVYINQKGSPEFIIYFNTEWVFDQNMEEDKKLTAKCKKDFAETYDRQGWADWREEWIKKNGGKVGHLGSGNTYNEDNAYFKGDVFEWTDFEDLFGKKRGVIVMWHNGGDVRGNYSDPMVYIGDFEDVYASLSVGDPDEEAAYLLGYQGNKEALDKAIAEWLAPVLGKKENMDEAKEKWVIKDWAGNYPFQKGGHQGSGHLHGPDMTFDSFDDAEEFLSDKLGDNYEEERGEYEIEPYKGSRESRYLDPRDPRGGGRKPKESVDEAKGILGKVKWFHDIKGLGVIVGDDGVDYFVSHKDLVDAGFKSLPEGERVHFEPGKDSHGRPVAKKVTKLGKVEAGAAPAAPGPGGAGTTTANVAKFAVPIGSKRHKKKDGSAVWEDDHDVSTQDGINALFDDILKMQLTPEDLNQIFKGDAINAEEVLKNFEEFKKDHPESILPKQPEKPAEMMPEAGAGAVKIQFFSDILDVDGNLDVQSDVLRTVRVPLSGALKSIDDVLAAQFSIDTHLQYAASTKDGVEYTAGPRTIHDEGEEKEEYIVVHITGAPEKDIRDAIEKKHEDSPDGFDEAKSNAKPWVFVYKSDSKYAYRLARNKKGMPISNKLEVAETPDWLMDVGLEDAIPEEIADDLEGKWMPVTANTMPKGDELKALKSYLGANISENITIEAKKPNPKGEFEKDMKQLAHDVGMNYDGGQDSYGNPDDRLHFDDERVTVFANLMKKSDYNKMEKDIQNFQVKGKGYTVGAWNDVSGYEYWKKQGEDGDSNYIQITAYVSEPTMVDSEKMKHDVQRAFEYFHGKYDNHDEGIEQVRSEKNKGESVDEAKKDKIIYVVSGHNPDYQFYTFKTEAEFRKHKKEMELLGWPSRKVPYELWRKAQGFGESSSLTEGAHDISFGLKGKASKEEIEAAFRRQRESDKAENGHQDGYSGDFQTVHGVDFKLDKVFEDQQSAYDYCLEHAKKWETVVAVYYKGKNGINTLVAGWGAS